MFSAHQKNDDKIKFDYGEGVWLKFPAFWRGGVMGYRSKKNSKWVNFDKEK